MGIFRRRHNHNGHKSPEASLAEAEAARRDQERKWREEEPVRQKLERGAEENDLARRFREAFGGGR